VRLPVPTRHASSPIGAGRAASVAVVKLRLFCALDLPEATIEAIARWQRREAGEGSGWRAVPRESLHLTLAFLGDRDEADVPAIAEAIAALPAEPVAAELRAEPRPIPPREPRMLALEASGERIGGLQAELGGRLTELGLYRPEKRPFWPHVTVLKRSRRRAGGRHAARVGPLPEAAPEGGGHAFGFVRVALYRSEIRPEGSSYSRLAARELPQPGGRQKR
jgi:RNA 2',3'-cyclic 3'-phosphodiesterase